MNAPNRNRPATAGFGRPASYSSQFEVSVKSAPREHILYVKHRLEHAYANSRMKNPKLEKAIAELDTEPGWFKNVNPIHQDIILDLLRDLANA